MHVNTIVHITGFEGFISLGSGSDSGSQIASTTNMLMPGRQKVQLLYFGNTTDLHVSNNSELGDSGTNAITLPYAVLWTTYARYQKQEPLPSMLLC